MNPRSIEEPCPIDESATLIPNEQKEHFKLLSRNKDAFAWSYEEMPRLDPKVAAKHWSIKKGVLPKKEPQWHFLPKLIQEIEKKVNKLIDDGIICEVKYQPRLQTSPQYGRKMANFILL